MENNDLQNRVVNATKWASITEIAAKVVTPVTNMILARILAPEVFGVVVTIIMVISFTDMFTDAGFQKYLVQYEFKNDDEKHKCTNVAFWTNFGISIFLWAIITLFRAQIAILVGNPSLGNVIAIACIQLPLTSFSSIQMALYRRDFNFKILFFARLVSICIPFVVTIPLVLLGFSYWALIVGILCGQLSNAIILTVKSKWKPKFIYEVNILLEMLSFSIWSLIEAVSIWLTTWVDAFIIGSALNEYYLGLYKTSIAMVNSLMVLATASVIPILFSALSRMQNDELAFRAMFYKMQRVAAYLIFPMGVGLFLYRNVATEILLGSQWSEASNIIGSWALTSTITIVFSNFNSEVYRSKGKPRLSFISQILHLSFLVPTCLISLNYGFWVLVYARSLIRLQGVLVDFIIMKSIMGFPVLTTVKNNIKPIICTFIMWCIAMLLKQISTSSLWSLVSIGICVFVYVAMMFIIEPEDTKYFIGKLVK